MVQIDDKWHVLPVGILGVWAGGEAHFCVCAVERDVEPCKERVGVYNGIQVSTGRGLRGMEGLQSLRVARRENGALKVRSSFFAVRRSISCSRTRGCEIP